MSNNKYALFLLIIVLFSQAASGQSDKAEKIADFLTPFVRNNQFSGAILASENGKVIFEKAFGLANSDYKIPNRVDTRIGIASISKPMTVVILHRLMESGKISKDDTLARFIPDFPNAKQITIEMLAGHRSGIPHRVMPPEAESVSYTSAEFVEKVKQAKPAFEPGTQRLYSSAGYSVLARTLEIASGKSYQQLLQEFVFTPADMKDSLDFQSETIMERRAQDYFLGPDGYVNAALKDYSFLIGAGSVFSTARDVYKFGNAVLQGKYGEDAKGSLMDESTITGSGSTNGHRAYFEIDRDKKYGYVVLSNLASGAFDLIAAGLKEILLGKEVTLNSFSIPKIIPNPNQDMSEFLGHYKRSGGGEFKVINRNDFLYAGDIKLYPIKPDCFFDYKYFGEVCFLKDESGKMKEIKWASPGIESTWIKQ